MNKLLILVAILVCSFALYGQEAKPTTVAASEVKTESSAKSSDTSALIFYRPKRFVGSGLNPSVYVNGEQVARLDNGRFFVLALAPGTYKIESSMKQDPLEIEVKAGKQDFLEMVILAGTWRGGGRFIPTGTNDAHEAIKKLKPLDKKWVTSEKVSFLLPDEALGNGN